MVFLSPLTSQLCCEVYLWKEAMNSRDEHGAEECQASLQHQRLFFQFFPFRGVAQPYSNKLHSLLTMLPSEISHPGLHQGATKADLLLGS